MTEIIILGIIISIIFYEITTVSPGGIIVPGLLVLYFNQLDRIAFTVVIALITCYTVKLLSRFFIIFGKRRLAVLILVSIFINFIFSLIFKSSLFSLSMINIIGYTIPGIIANDIYKQGAKRTIPALGIVLCLLELIIICLK